MSKQEILLSNSAIEFLKDEIGGGTNVVANPTLSGTETVLTGLQVGNTKYAVPQGRGSMEIVTLNYVLDVQPQNIDEQPHNITQEQATKLQNGAILTDEEGRVFSLVGILPDNGSILFYQFIVINANNLQIEEVDRFAIDTNRLLYQCITEVGQQQ